MNRIYLATSLLIAGALAAPDASAATASPDEIRAMVSEMLADSETRSSLLQSGATGGHDGKFFIASPDGAFRLNIGGQIQFRYIVNFRDDTAPFTDPDDPGAGDIPVDAFVSGFQTRRTRVQFDGHAFDPRFNYVVQIEGARSGGGVRLLDAYVGYDLGDGFNIRWGQFKLPFLLEENMSSRRQLAVDRSLTNSIFSQGRSQAVELGWAGEAVRAKAAFSNGFNSVNTDLLNKPAEWAFTGRVEGLVMGNWRQFRQFTSPRESENGLMLGAAAHIQGAPDTGAGDPLSRIFSWTADAIFHGDGFNLFGAVVGRHGDKLPGSSDDFGYVIQGGFYVADDVELFARWDHTFNDDDLRTITAGFNYFIHGHAAKFVMDVQWFLDEALTGGSTAVGFLTPTDENQVALRFMFQLLF